VIGVEQRVGPDAGFKAVDGAAGMNQAERTVGSNNQVGRLAEQVAAAAIAPIVGRDQTEVLNHLSVDAHDGTGASLREVLAEHGWIHDLEVTLDAADFEVEARARVNRQLG